MTAESDKLIQQQISKLFDELKELNVKISDVFIAVKEVIAREDNYRSEIKEIKQKQKDFEEIRQGCNTRVHDLERDVQEIKVDIDALHKKQRDLEVKQNKIALTNLKIWIIGMSSIMGGVGLIKLIPSIIAIWKS